ncbi:MAG: DNA polymerase beta domain protein region [Acetothermia bacterium 64_32]|nr:MAG: DNA polymerase beta domain protein region [Acetothermia bacterium 64_32]HAF70683.1 nucleotidyltransferase [Candidatus Acetothermia bacterium]
MKTLEDIRRILAQHKNELEERYGVKELGIFGSYSRGEQRELSDVDILIRLKKPIGFRFLELWDYLEELLGVKVDLLTPNALKQKPQLWESVKEDLIHV